MTYHQKADQEFLAKARKLSPVFPSAETLRVRRQRAREQYTARVFLLGTGMLMAAAPFTDRPLVTLGAALIPFFGFVATCFVAGNREYKRDIARHG